MKSDTSGHQPTFSIYDTIEQLQVSTQLILGKCDKKLSKQLKNIFQQWERAVAQLVSEKQTKEQEFSDLKEKYCQSKSIELKLRIKLTQKKSKETEMIREIQAIKDHLEEGKEMWAKQIKKIEEVMQEQERSKQKIESLYQQRLSEIDAELDDIMHIHKKKLELSQNLREILPVLFSQEELQEEKKIALGEISHRKHESIEIKKLENASVLDINSENSMPSMNFEDLKGTQRVIFERLLELRKKVYKFKHDDTTCSENSSTSLAIELRSISQEKFIQKILNKTCALKLKASRSGLVSYHAGIVFGLAGSDKYREGLTDLIKSDKLSISEREKIVYNLINGEISSQAKTNTMHKEDLIKKDHWGDVSSIHGGSKELEMSQDLQHIFSKESINFSKASVEFHENPLSSLKREEEFLHELEEIFSNQSVEVNPEKKLEKAQIAEEIKEQEMSSMSIIKDFSRNISISSRRRLSDESRRDSVADTEDVNSSRRKFSVEQREPSSSFIVPVTRNLFFIPDPVRPRSNPRVVLKPDERVSSSFRSRDSSGEESSVSNHRNSAKPYAENQRKPISMMNKLPVLPKPPVENKKINVKSFRGRSLIPIQNQANRIVHSPPARKVANSDIKSASPGGGLKFRMRRFKEIAGNAGKSVKSTSKTVIAKKK